eukprot:CAMPEP_0171152398 /NCGR_PEP_ID=MMETSP0766_2-20121228/150548_1 /TAXON_ID=439317 /ORGANISM="Gambierdiscus australes, Strain CAWD 149" /LENGTH=43 /DNA_ID= /DNA_START= /DNA_END= /DNA_ORIENTATION=
MVKSAPATPTFASNVEMLRQGTTSCGWPCAVPSTRPQSVAMLM